MGEATALPSLAARILALAGRSDWKVPRDAIRLPRGLLVDERKASPLRPPRKEGFEKAVGVARAQGASALVVLVDADDDCPVSFGPPAAALFHGLAGKAVMAVREFETWLLLNHSPQDLANAGVKSPERIRDAKKALARLVPGYLPTTHQLQLARSIDIDQLRGRSKSFDKFARCVLDVTGS